MVKAHETLFQLPSVQATEAVLPQQTTDPNPRIASAPLDIHVAGTTSELDIGCGKKFPPFPPKTPT